ncbi:hypothetical protein Q9G90_00105 [Corynebacterium stationis]|uniref:hypothetical protein n=1 Tax=Corynebacterium stationis TaxID=1705 RepID=UPI00273C8993|nr:hypothetical protein [Corynebacterium stationis]WLP87126.1 hypothetical protein Q9G90_00105 [Corynebacterium stationis]
MFQFVVGAAAGYVLGTKAGRKRFHQIKNAYEKTVNSPVAKSAVSATRKTIANRLDPDPRMREIKDFNRGKKKKNDQEQSPDRIYEVDED